MVSTTGMQLTDAVLRSFAQCADPRLKTIMESLVRHLHGFIRDVDLTPDEWRAGIEFLTATGHKCDAKRQEFILLSDVLGASMLVVDLAQARAKAAGTDSATEATVEGPFYWEGAPLLPLGSNIAEGVTGEPCLYHGRVADTRGRPLAGALLDVWSGDGEGVYDMQLGEQGGMRARGRFRADDEGRYWFWSIRPTFYPVPVDGPVGQMFNACGRDENRPGHIHLKVSAPRHAGLTTHLFVAGSRYIDSDVVFGVRDSLVVDFKQHGAGTAIDGRKVDGPYWSAHYDFRLAPQNT